MAAKIQYVGLDAKTEIGQQKLGYHGSKWLHLGEEVPKYARYQGLCLVLRSRDGSKVLFVRKCNDPDLSWRML